MAPTAEEALSRLKRVHSFVSVFQFMESTTSLKYPCTPRAGGPLPLSPIQRAERSSEPLDRQHPRPTRREKEKRRGETGPQRPRCAAINGRLWLPSACNLTTLLTGNVTRKQFYVAVSFARIISLLIGK